MTGTLAARAALVREFNTPLSIEDVEIEAPRETEVRVRMVGSGVCHTDMVFCEGGAFALPLPCLLGHEGSGVVEAVGSAVTGLVPGDHVVLSFSTCGHCPACAKARPANCHNMAAYNYGGGRVSDGSSPVSGSDGERINAAFFSQSSFATHAIADQRNAVKVRKDVPLDILGPLGCGIQTGAGAAMNSMRIGAGESVVVFGGGAVGLSALLGALAVGAGMAIVVEPNAERRALATDLGAAHTIDPAATADILAAIRALSGGGGVDHAIDTTGLPDVLAVACEAVTFGGKVGILGIPPVEASLPANILSLMSRGVHVMGVVEGDADPQRFIPELIDLYRDGRFPFDRLITKFPFDQINEAIEGSRSGKAVKPVLTF